MGQTKAHIWMRCDCVLKCKRVTARELCARLPRHTGMENHRLVIALAQLVKRLGHSIIGGKTLLCWMQAKPLCPQLGKGALQFVCGTAHLRIYARKSPQTIGVRGNQHGNLVIGAKVSSACRGYIERHEHALPHVADVHLDLKLIPIHGAHMPHTKFS